MTRIPFGVTGGFQVGHSGSGNHHKTFRVSGRALCVGKNGCGPRKFVAFGAEIREIMIRVLMVRSLVQLEELHRGLQPRTRLSGPMVARTRFPVNTRLLRLCSSSLRLRMLFRGLQVCVDLVRELLKNILSSDDCAKYGAQLEPPKREEPTIYQDLAHKFKEHGKVLSQVEHHRNVVRDAQLKLQKHQGILQELLDRSQSLQLEIDSLQEQADAAKAASASVLPPMPPPSFPPEDAPAVNADDLSGVQIQEIQEEMKRWRRLRKRITEVVLERF